MRSKLANKRFVGIVATVVVCSIFQLSSSWNMVVLINSFHTLIEYMLCPMVAIRGVISFFSWHFSFHLCSFYGIYHCVSVNWYLLLVSSMHTWSMYKSEYLLKRLKSECNTNTVKRMQRLNDLSASCILKFMKDDFDCVCVCDAIVAMQYDWNFSSDCFIVDF